MDSTDAPQIIEHIHKQIAFTPYDNKWIPFSKRFVAMGIHPNAKGALQVTVTARQYITHALQIYELNKGDLDLVGDFNQPHGIKCGTFGASSIEERHLATGDHVGKLTIYDLDRIDTPVFSQQVIT
jgi:WD repeat-containing protein 92